MYPYRSNTNIYQKNTSINTRETNVSVTKNDLRQTSFRIIRNCSTRNNAIIIYF